jgi:hypothetical protein
MGHVSVPTRWEPTVFTTLLEKKVPLLALVVAAVALVALALAFWEYVGHVSEIVLRSGVHGTTWRTSHFGDEFLDIDESDMTWRRWSESGGYDESGALEKEGATGIYGLYDDGELVGWLVPRSVAGLGQTDGVLTYDGETVFYVR